MDRESDQRAAKIREYLNRPKKGPKGKNMVEGRLTNKNFTSFVRKQPGLYDVRKINANALPFIMGPFYRFATDLTETNRLPFKIIRSPLDIIPNSTAKSILIGHRYSLETPANNPDLWMRIVCVYLYKFVEHVVHSHGFVGWAEKFAWYKNSSAKYVSYRYFDPAKTELNLTKITNVYLHPYERDFLHLALDFFTSKFILLPGSAAFETYMITARLLDCSYVDQGRVDAINWKRLSGIDRPHHCGPE